MINGLRLINFCEISDQNQDIMVDWTKLMSDISSNQDNELTYTTICVVHTDKTELFESVTQSSPWIYCLVISSK